MLTSNLEQAQ